VTEEGGIAVKTVCGNCPCLRQFREDGIELGRAETGLLQVCLARDVVLARNSKYNLLRHRKCDASVGQIRYEAEKVNGRIWRLFVTRFNEEEEAK
jgi:hypothetical protein